MNSSIDTISKRTLVFRCSLVALLTVILTFIVIHWIWSLDAFPKFLSNQSALGLNYIRSPGDTSMLFGNIYEINSIRKNGGLTVASDIDSSVLAFQWGIRPGDKITAINGISLQENPKVFYRAFSKKAKGQKLEIKFIRDGIVSQIESSFAIPDSLMKWGGQGSWAFSVGNVKGVYTFDTFRLVADTPYLFLSILLLLVGCIIGLLKPSNSVAFQISILFLLLGCMANSMQFDWFRLSAILPAWLLITTFAAFALAHGIGIPLLLRVLSVFPNPTRLGRLFLRFQWIAFIFFLTPAIIEFSPKLVNLLGLDINLFDSIFIEWVHKFDNWLLLFALIVGLALLISQHIETRHRHEYRLKIIEFSFLIGLLGVVLYYVALYVFSRANISLSQNMANIIVVLWNFTPTLAVGTIPLAVTYTIITRKIFDIKFIIRKGLQYLLLSKGALVIEGIIVFLVVFQVITHGGENIAGSPFAVSSLSVGSTLAVIFVLGKVNRKVMPAIDRRFFREVLDVRKLLLDLNQQISAIREQEEILQQTANTILRTLHPARVVMFLKHGKSDEFRCELTLENERAKPTQPRHAELVSASIPSNVQIPNHLPAASLMQAGVRNDGLVSGMLKTDDTIIKQLEEKKGWVIVYPETLDLEKDEDQRLSAVNCELLIGLRGSSGLIGVMGLGDKLSEEPYSKEDRELLLTVAHEMGMALENAELLEVAKREAEFSKELDIARQVQQNLFPKQLPTPSGWEFAGICKPAKAVGGDYYDIFEAVPGKVVIALGDVSGKGLGASFVMSGVHSTIRTNAEKSIDNPVGLINELNKYLLESTSKNIFVTLFFGIIDLETGKLCYVNCGHPPVLVVRKVNGEIEKLTRTGLALGMMNTVQFTQGTSTLKAGDSLIVYSDGITEAMNEKNEEYEEEKLIKLLNEGIGLDTSQMMEEILKSVSDFIGQAEQSDDVSIILTRRKLETG